jgi:DNA-binding CsgD family transcriptional regulator
MYGGPSAPVLRGRRNECEALDRLLQAAHSGRASALVVRGASGVGKTALLEYALAGASGWQTARAAGVESEMELAFAGLHQLCAPMFQHLDCLPIPQRDALSVAFGFSEGAVRDRFLVGVAILGLLSEVADEKPLLCVIDDAQWLDQASAQCLAFVARRLEAERLTMVFAVREPSAERELLGLPELFVEGLGEADAHKLLASAIPGPLDEQVRDQVIAETRGNPLALLELPRGMTRGQLAGGFGLPDARPLSRRVEQSFRDRVRALPDETQMLLLVASADPVGDVTLCWRAAQLLGIGPGVAAPAETDGLIEFGSRVRFRHPLVRSATYRAASREDRQKVHRALADATDPVLDPDRRAWHRAHAASAPDEEVADELERAAARAEGRGGVAAAAAFLERAAELTPEPTRRGARALAAAQAKFDAAAPEVASELLASASICPLDELQRGQLERLRARIAFARTRGSDVPMSLLAAAERLAPIDGTLARETYLEALWAAVRCGRFGSEDMLLEVAEAARRAPPAPLPPRAIDLLLDGLVVRATEGYAAAAPNLARAVAAFRREGLSGHDIGWCWLACHTAMDLWDDDACAELSGGLAQLARETGALVALPFALNYVAAHRLFAGEFDAAATLIEEADAITEATGIARIADFSVLLAGWRGQQERTLRLREAIITEATRRGEGLAIALAEWAASVLYNGLGGYGDALLAAQRASENDQLGFGAWVLPELVEAAARSGQYALARDALEQLAVRTGLSSTDWAAGIEARSRALLSEGQAAEDLYVNAIDRLGRSRIVVHLARAHLIYGEWLRRENRRIDARGQLRTALGLLESIGAEAFAERTRRELRATGEKVRTRSIQARDELTDQESLIARLARDGQSNPQISAQLFLSPRTVEWHLSKVFAKLSIGSRHELHAALRDDNRAPVPG